MSSWSCPHDLNGVCQRVRGAVCVPGMRGCELEGKVRFANEARNTPAKPVKAEPKRSDEPKAPRRRLSF